MLYITSLEQNALPTFNFFLTEDRLYAKMHLHLYFKSMPINFILNYFLKAGKYSISYCNSKNELIS